MLLTFRIVTMYTNLRNIISVVSKLLLDSLLCNALNVLVNIYVVSELIINTQTYVAKHSNH